MSRYTLAEQLEDATARVHTLGIDYQRAVEVRKRLVREAMKNGWTHAEIAEATGLSRGRVGQIAARRQ